jgi:hypothetical protein
MALTSMDHFEKKSYQKRNCEVCGWSNILCSILQYLSITPTGVILLGYTKQKSGIIF